MAYVVNHLPYDKLLYVISNLTVLKEGKTIRYYRKTGDKIYLPFLLGRKLSNEPNDIISPNVNIQFTGDLRYEQLVVANEAINQLNSARACLLRLYPGFGKTVIALYLACNLKLRTLVLVNRNIILTQWENSIKKFTNSTNEIIVRMGNNISQIDDRYTLIIDEVHAFCSPVLSSNILKLTPKYLILLSATPERDDGLDIFIDAMVGDNRVIREYMKKHTVYLVNTNRTYNIKYTPDNRIDWHDLQAQLISDQQRNQLIVDITLSATDKTCILTWRKDHAKILYDLISNKISDVDYLMGNKNKYKDSRVLIGTISKIGTGFDESSSCCDYNGIRIKRLILVGTTKSNKVIEQTLGRVFRADTPTIMVLVDNVPIIKYHWSKIKSWCIKHGGKILEYQRN